MAKIGLAVRQNFEAVTDLILVTRSKPEREKLLDLQMQLGAKLQRLIDRAVDEALPEYRKAQVALKDATKAAKDAKAGLTQVADAIAKLAVAVGLVARLAAVLA